MTATVAIKPIKPKKGPDKQVFIDAWNEVLDQTARTLKKDEESTVRTFKSKPKVNVAQSRGSIGRFLSSKSGDLFRAVYVDNEIYFYLSRGTKVRWALMSSDWRSKTRPRRIPAGRGRGRAVVMGRRAMMARGIGPRPGIKARKFDKMIARKRNKPFIRDVRRATRSASRKAF